MKLHDLKQAEMYLLGYSPEKQSGATYTLERMKRLMDRLGNPQNDIAAVHIAGTSGKTSTAYYVRGLLQARGMRTGLTASPHVTSITERVQVDGEPLPDEKFIDYLNEFLEAIEPWKDIRPTYFELLIALAFWVFRREAVDYSIIEVGLGGLLDATNVMSRNDKVSVLTPIGLDHTDVLGDTVAEIAAQKAGIILPGSKVFSADQEPEARAVIRVVAPDTVFVSNQGIEDSDLPIFQQRNFTLARTVVEFIALRDGLAEDRGEAADTVLSGTPPGRFEVYRMHGKTIIIDGAHNPQKLAALVTSLDAKYPHPMSWLVGFAQAPDAKIESCIEAIAHPNDQYMFTNFSIGQDIKRRACVDADDLQARADKYAISTSVEPDAQLALRRLLESKQRTIVVTGSLYLVSLLVTEIRRLATLQPAGLAE